LSLPTRGWSRASCNWKFFRLLTAVTVSGWLTLPARRGQLPRGRFPRNGQYRRPSPLSGRLPVPAWSGIRAPATAVSPFSPGSVRHRRQQFATAAESYRQRQAAPGSPAAVVPLPRVTGHSCPDSVHLLLYGTCSSFASSLGWVAGHQCPPSTGVTVRSVTQDRSPAVRCADRKGSLSGINTFTGTLIGAGGGNLREGKKLLRYRARPRT
jgi:hypothetical protein